MENIKKLVDEHNAEIEKLKSNYPDKVDISTWFKFNEELQPLIRKGVTVVQRLHCLGYTDYKINMQTGIIK